MSCALTALAALSKVEKAKICHCDDPLSLNYCNFYNILEGIILWM